MTDAPGEAVIPAWVAPNHGRVAEAHHLIHQLVEVVGNAEHRGQLAAVEWVTNCRPTAPVTHRDENATRDAVRGEALIAVHVAAEGAPLLERDWYRFGLDPDVYYLPAVETDPEFAFGAWSVLAWVSGSRKRPPVELPERDAAGRLVGGPRYVTPPDPASPIWQAADARRRHRCREAAIDQVDRIRQYLRTRATA